MSGLTALTEYLLQNCYKVYAGHLSVFQVLIAIPQNGMLPVVLTKDQVELCMQEAKAGHALTIDLPNQVVILPNGSHLPFDVQSHLKNCLINGWDDITLTMHHIDEIAKFEQHRSAVWPWLDGNGYLSRDAQGRIAVLAEGRTDW
jgi:3-isopropylmalate dehydratase